MSPKYRAIVSLSGRVEGGVTTMNICNKFCSLILR